MGTGDLTGKVALVLGGGSIGAGWSIGRAISVSFAREGANTIIADVNYESAKETLAVLQAERLAGAAEACDVLDDAQLEQVVHRVVERYGRLDILHCNVGLGKAGPSAATTAADWRRISDANLTSLHVASSAALPVMRAQGSGVILTTASIAGIRDVGIPHAAYGATKAAAIHLMRIVAIENARYGIRANTIVVGLADTPRIEQALSKAYGNRPWNEVLASRAAQVPLGRMASPFDVANAACFLASDKAAYITATEIVVDGGLTATVNRSPYSP